MKKAIISMLLVVCMSLAITACGDTTNTNTETQIKEPTKEATGYDDSTLESILSSIETDFTDTIQSITTQYEEANQTIGGTYDGYVSKKQMLIDWYSSVLTEEEALFSRTQERSKDYFKLIATSIDHEDDDAIDDAMDEYYDRIYDGVMDDFYDEVYDGLLDDAYDDYYDGVVSDGYDVAPYEDWLDESSDCYEIWLDTASDCYEIWLDAASDLYEDWLSVSSEFYDGNYDINSILGEDESEAEESDVAAPTEKDSNVSEEEGSKSNESAGIDLEFKAAMDSYEAFFDEYVEFMKKYMNASTDDMFDMMDDYADYMEQYAETMGKIDAIDEDELTMAEAEYYLEVTLRIEEKLLEVY